MSETQEFKMAAPDDEEREKIDLTSPKFQPLTALYSKDVTVPRPAVRQFNNVAEYERYMLTGEVPGTRSKKPAKTSATKTRAELLQRICTERIIDSTKRDSDNDEDIEPGMARAGQYGRYASKRNVLSRMEEENQGPMSMLYRSVEDKLRIRVCTRTFKGLRGMCTGYLVAYDKYWNLAMVDVDEVYKKPSLGKKLYNEERLTCRKLIENSVYKEDIGGQSTPASDDIRPTEKQRTDAKDDSSACDVDKKTVTVDAPHTTRGKKKKERHNRKQKTDTHQNNGNKEPDDLSVLESELASLQEKLALLGQDEESNSDVVIAMTDDAVEECEDEKKDLITINQGDEDRVVEECVGEKNDLKMGTQADEDVLKDRESELDFLSTDGTPTECNDSSKTIVEKTKLKEVEFKSEGESAVISRKEENTTGVCKASGTATAGVCRASRTVTSEITTAGSCTNTTTSETVCVGESKETMGGSVMSTFEQKTNKNHVQRKRTIVRGDFIRRHVNQMLIRGDNVVMVMMCSDKT
ncbi:uncharacterized protein LOC102806831 [Saccoglossus kowalevskii]|uniref:Uncharacterized protein LOC102806831 n=1 Tax=Saccoglossus kowalevskii TaxID=10224 RepID=A0ABM0MP77_SACKO|nr:PREDICTED: uncharacterized protein LOC102806831 [Saccoglossus kowalevskii]